jgi:outer membrane protein TolC
MPLDSSGLDARPLPPDRERIRLLARDVKHPLLQPVEIDGRALTPDAAAIFAVIVNPGLRAARGRSAVARAQVLQAGILPNPQLSASRDIPITLAPGLVSAFNLALEWGIRNILLRKPDVEAARAGLQSVDLGIAWQEWQVAQSARLHVYNLLLLDKQLEIERREEADLQRNRDAVARAYEMRDMTIIDMAAADAALQQARAAVRDIEKLREEERLDLNETLGLAPNETVALREQGSAVPKVFPSLEALLEGTEQRRLDLLALRKGYESQEARLRSAVLGQFPRLSFGLSRARDTGNINTRGFGLTLELPSFDRNQGAIAIEGATRQQLHDEYGARLFEVRAGIARLLADASASQRQIEVNELAVVSLRRLVENYRLGLLAQNVDVLSYYNARRDLVAAELTGVRLQQDLVNIAIGLEIATGRYKLEEVPQ